MNRGSVYIIPDENKILEECFSRKVEEDHLPYFQEFSDKYKLGYKFELSDYQDAPCKLAKDGHLVIKTVDDSGLFICYLPKIVTDRQTMWVYNNMELMNMYQTVGGYSIEDNEIKQIYGTREIMNEANHKNSCYIGEEDNYVGKKI